MRRLFAAILTLLAGFALSPAPAHADGFIVVERPPEPLIRRWRHRPRQSHFPLIVKRHQVKVEIKGTVAITSVDQVFHNPNSTVLEGTYIFPLPKDAAVTKFSLFINGKETPGEILDSSKARSIYEGIVRRMKDPALLEYMGRGAFKCRIYPLPANGDRRIKLSYSQVLKRDHGRGRYVYPLNTEKFSAAPLDSASIQVKLDSDLPLRSIFSPSHPNLDLRRKGETTALASWEARRVRPNKDFVLCYDVSDKDVGMSLWTYKRPTRDGFFLLSISPKTKITSAEIAKKDIVFVFDTSGSMMGKPLSQGQKALKYCIQNLNPGDRFNVVAFSSEASPFAQALMPATKEARSRAVSDIDELRARGGTNIHEALSSALAMRPKQSDGRPFIVVFMTDGLPTMGKTDPAGIRKDVLAAAGKNTRIFTLGIGTEVNTKLLDSIAEGTRAEHEYVLPDEDLEVKLAHFYDKLAYPVISNCKLVFEGIWVKETFPKRLPDLFKGATLQVVGRYKGSGAVTVRLRGQVNGKPIEYVVEGKFGAESQELDFLPGRWARQKIGFLLDQIRLHGESKELKEEVVFLAKKYGLPTPYTSYLVVEDESPKRARPGLAGGRQPEAKDEADGAARRAFGALRKARDDRRAKSGRAPAAAKAPMEKESGRGAVEQSQALKKLKSGASSGTDDIAEELVRKVMRKIGAKTFYRAGERWLDSSLKPGAKADLEVSYLSDEYFALAKRLPALGPILALGGKLVFEHDGKVYRIK